MMECLICYKKVDDSINQAPSEIGQNFFTVICKLFSIPPNNSTVAAGLCSSPVTSSICPDCNHKCWRVQEIFAQLDQIRGEIQAELFGSQKLARQNGHFCPERDAIIHEIKKVNGDEHGDNLDLDVKIPLGFIDEISTCTGSPLDLGDGYSFPAQVESLDLQLDHFEDQKDLNAFNNESVTMIGKEIRIILERLPFIDGSAGLINVKKEPWSSFIKRNHKTIKYYNNKEKRSKLKSVIKPRPKPTKPIDPDFKTKTNKRSQVHITTCSECNITFKTRRELLDHNLESHSEIFHCRQCPKTYRNKTNFTEHLRTHGIGDTLFKCTTCDKLFPRNHQLREHNLIVHEKIKPFLCHLCSNEIGFINRASLRNHISSHHNNDQKANSTLRLRKSLYCHQCPQSFKNRGSLKYHISSRHGHNNDQKSNSTALHCHQSSKKIKKINGNEDCDNLDLDVKIPLGFIDEISTCTGSPLDLDDDYSFPAQVEVEGLDLQSDHTEDQKDLNAFNNAGVTTIEKEIRIILEPLPFIDVSAGLINVKIKEEPWASFIKRNHNKTIKKNKIQRKRSRLVSLVKPKPTTVDPDFKTKRIYKKRSIVHITTCTECNITFKTRRELLDHNLESHSEIFHCRQCPKTYRNKTNFNEHLRTHGIGDTLFKCNTCDKLFPRNHQLREHNLIVHEQIKPFLCHLCSNEIGFINRASLRNHISSHHNNDQKANSTLRLRKSLYCQQCPQSFKNRGSLKYHISSRHGHTNDQKSNSTILHCHQSSKSSETKPNSVTTAADNPDFKFSKIYKKKSRLHVTTCSKCNITFNTRPELLDHNKKSHSSSLFCHQCPKICRNETSLTEHLRTHGIGDTLFKCDIDNCDKLFSQNDQLNEHRLVVHEKIKPLLCHICSKGFMKNTYLERHISSFHNNEQKFKCTESNCEKTFTTRYLMTKHVQNEHKKETIYFCPVESCKKEFVTIFNQKRHYNFVHLHFKHPKKFKCSECEKLFFSNANLRNHVAQWHSKSFDFPCQKPKCDKIFATQRKLKHHLLVVHLEGESRHPCTHPNCPKKFYEKQDLQMHYLSNHADESEKPLICSICSKRFASNYKLKRHKKQVHKIGAP